MTLEEYVDRYGVNVDELAILLLRKVEYLDDLRKQELVRTLQPEGKSAAQTQLLNLMDEASENLELARRLRDAVTTKEGTLMGTVGETAKVIMAADKAVDSAAKRWQTVYNVSTMQAVEECVKEVLEDMDQDAADRFLTLLEERLKSIR